MHVLIESWKRRLAETKALLEKHPNLKFSAQLRGKIKALQGCIADAQAIIDAHNKRK